MEKAGPRFSSFEILDRVGFQPETVEQFRRWRPMIDYQKPQFLNRTLGLLPENA